MKVSLSQFVYPPNLWKRFIFAVQQDLFNLSPVNGFTPEKLQSKSPAEIDDLHASHLADLLRRYLVQAYGYLQFLGQPGKLRNKALTEIERGKIPVENAKRIHSLWSELQSVRCTEEYDNLCDSFLRQVHDLEVEIRAVYWFYFSIEIFWDPSQKAKAAR